ncbi:MAG TPA: electron transfer flavoprotein subunit beta/FixA family protein [Candidatus Obscuribacter sp.]|nr:electron transfer flavoprotein subunit beta/FixA family protein [Candidatus Obscuribacter sp.]MBK9282336.1 electron transfer flavoprotein subunit beta/FixA family protein [Candidatus Obscuribacter sp.]HMW90812.1 electron transfer flavoprotein subunit beta/FixA family protein [Candidatus Obscuribacter sp.]HNG21015.1 electron transfer flavoprotein subunit beta/FixA family protein [Candidatus Obscuribacter sp.]HNH76642.1 electron transfer flavoprotein subunit beta/FixA family protein [Candidatu
MSGSLNIFVLVKQVPDQGSKAGLNPDGTIDRAKAKRMLNPFDRYALQAALHAKKCYGGRVTAISMGPPPAVEVLLETLEHGVDEAFLLSDRRLAASDTLATAYALFRTVSYVGKPDLVFCGLQTTDGDTAQVGPQLAERMGLPQITYCEDFSIENNKVHGRRIIEGGYQKVVSEMPLLVTVANSYHPLEYKSFRGAWKVQRLARNEEELKKFIHTIDLDIVKADPDRTGLKGSPTIVAATEKVGELGGSCKMHEGQSVETLVQSVIKESQLEQFFVA